MTLMSTVLALQTNSCDQNLSFCLEFIEQVAKMQGQLFGILTTTAQEGENGLCFPIRPPLRFCVCSELACLGFSRWPDLWILLGGRYDGVEVIKSRLLPWLETAFTAASLGKPIDSKVPSLQVRMLKDSPWFSAPWSDSVNSNIHTIWFWPREGLNSTWGVGTQA